MCISERVCVVLVVMVGGRRICEYKTVILSVHSQTINSMITHQSGCCVWLHNHRSKSHSHSAPSYQRGYCFNPLLCGSEWGYGGFVLSWLIQLYQSSECRPITLSILEFWGCNWHTHAYTQLESNIDIFKYSHCITDSFSHTACAPAAPHLSLTHT